MKKIFIILSVVFMTFIILTLISLSEKKYKNDDINNNKLNSLNNIDKKIDFFNYNNIDRYISYKNKNSNLKDIDIITRVNLNLDYPFYTHTKQSNLLNKKEILVNKYIYLPSNYVPDNLSIINQKYANSNKLLVDEAKDEFENMAEDALQEGYTIRAISAYRSYEYQSNLYNEYANKDGIELADTYSARPGFSEHQTGLVVDIDNGEIDYNSFEITNEFIWMQENSYKYGFILRYPKDKEDITGYNYESWHYRYVGEEIAKYIKDNNLCLDEYYVRFIDN